MKNARHVPLRGPISVDGQIIDSVTVAWPPQAVVAALALNLRNPGVIAATLSALTGLSIAAAGSMDFEDAESVLATAREMI